MHSNHHPFEQSDHCLLRGYTIDFWNHFLLTSVHRQGDPYVPTGNDVLFPVDYYGVESCTSSGGSGPYSFRARESISTPCLTSPVFRPGVCADLKSTSFNRLPPESGHPSTRESVPETSGVHSLRDASKRKGTSCAALYGYRQVRLRLNIKMCNTRQLIPIVYIWIVVQTDGTNPHNPGISHRSDRIDQVSRRVDSR